MCNGPEISTVEQFKLVKFLELLIFLIFVDKFKYIMKKDFVLLITWDLKGYPDIHKN